MHRIPTISGRTAKAARLAILTDTPLWKDKFKAAIGARKN
jgi:hypothetical protein